LAALFLFKEPLTKLLNSISKFKYKDFEMTFSEGLSEAKKNMLAENHNEIYLGKEEEKLLEESQKSPRTLILEAWIEIETAAAKKLTELYGKIDKNYTNRTLNLLINKRVLSPNTIQVIEQLRSLRNQASHQPDFSVTPEQAFEYAKLSRSIKTEITKINSVPSQHLRSLTLMILEINHLIDSKKFDDVSTEEIKKHIRNKTVMDFLKTRGKDEIDISILLQANVYPNFKEFYEEQLLKILDAYAGDERKKWGVENRGLCLLIAWTNEIIQQGYGWHPSNL